MGGGGLLFEAGRVLTFSKNKKSKNYCKAYLKQRMLFFITIFRLAIPSSGLQMLLCMASRNIVIINNIRCFKSALQ